jgi:uncharacterized protein (DUF2252 family)
MGLLETWYLHAYPGRDNPLGKMDAKSQAISRKLLAKAATQTNAMLLRKVADKQADGGWRFRENPPVLTRVDPSTRKSVEEALEAYAPTLPREREFMFKKYRIADVAHRVVGLGSVGTRAYLVLLFGNGDSDPSSRGLMRAPPMPQSSPGTVASRHRSMTRSPSGRKRMPTKPCWIMRHWSKH